MIKVTHMQAKSWDAEAELMRLRAKVRREGGRLLEQFKIHKGREKKCSGGEHFRKTLTDIGLSRKLSMIFSRCWELDLGHLAS